MAELRDRVVGGRGELHGVGGDAGGLLRVVGDLPNRGVQFADGQGNGFGVLADLLGHRRRTLGLFRRLLGVDGHLAADVRLPVGSAIQLAGAVVQRLHRSLHPVGDLIDRGGDVADFGILVTSQSPSQIAGSQRLQTADTAGQRPSHAARHEHDQQQRQQQRDAVSDKAHTRCQR